MNLIALHGTMDIDYIRILNHQEPTPKLLAALETQNQRLTEQQRTNPDSAGDVYVSDIPSHPAADPLTDTVWTARDEDQAIAMITEWVNGTDTVSD